MDYGPRTRARFHPRMGGKRLRFGPAKAGVVKRRRRIPNMKRKRVPRRPAMLRNVRRRVTSDDVQYTQQKVVKFKKGRKLTRRSLIDKTVMLNSAYFQYAFRNYVNGGTTAQFANSLGQYVTGSLRYLPLYVFGIDIIAQPGGLASVPFCKRAVMDIAGATDGFIQWVDVVGGTAFGSTSFQPYRISDNDLTAPVVNKALLSNAYMQFNLMGARALPTRVDMRLMEVLDDQYDPWESGQDDMNTYWQWYVSRYTCNEIHSIVKPRLGKEPFKILDSKSFQFQPTSTTETDARAHIITPKWFWQCNRVCDYTEGSRQHKVVDDATISSNQTGDNLGRIPNSRPRHKQLLLVVSALAPIVGVAPSAANDASMEWNIRTTYRKLDRGG